jgi:hypothetical protein
LTIARRSGVKTSVCDLAAQLLRRRSVAPFSVACFAARRRRDGDLARRRSRGSAECDRAASRAEADQLRDPARRGEKPCVPTCSDSSRFVLPAPFGPDGEHEPGSQLELEPAYERKSGARPSETISRRA